MKRRYRIGCLLFSVCFFIYAVSPLSAVYQRNQVTEQTDSTSFGIRLLVVELLLSPLSRHDEDNETSSRVLLKKKRATLSPDKLKISKKHLKNDIVSSSVIISSRAASLWVSAQDKEPALQTSSHLPHSGLSPPSV